MRRCDFYTEILRVLCYSAVFKVGLRVKDVYKYISIPSSIDEIKNALEYMKDKGVIFESNGYYSINKAFVENSPLLSSGACKKVRKSLLILRSILHLPFVRGLFITGSYASGFAKETDDLDVMIVCKSGRIYTCRFFVALINKLVGPFLCPNYFISDKHLKFEKDYYVAREIAQMIPVNSEEIYERILSLNPWIYEYFPNFKGERKLEVKFYSFLREIFEFLARVIPESFLRFVQLRRFYRKYTHADGEVVISEHIFKAHVIPHRRKILKDFRKILKSYGIREFQ